MAKTAKLIVKTPDGQEGVVATALLGSSLEELADATEKLLDQRDRWVSAGQFPAGSTWRMALE